MDDDEKADGEETWQEAERCHSIARGASGMQALQLLFLQVHGAAYERPVDATGSELTLHGLRSHQRRVWWGKSEQPWLRGHSSVEGAVCAAAVWEWREQPFFVSECDNQAGCGELHLSSPHICNLGPTIEFSSSVSALGSNFRMVPAPGRPTWTSGED